MRRVAVVVGLLACSFVAAGGQGAHAATTTDYGSWTFTGTNNSFTGTVGLATGFPAVEVRTDSLTPPTPAIATGASVWLPTGTSFADVFGSSQNQPYLNLRPKANNSNAGSLSTTTYTFASPTPAGTWGINLGDIDAERLRVSATGVGGAAVSVADLGFGGSYNYCDASPRSSACSGDAAPYPVPHESDSGNVVTLEDLACPATTARCNTDGESAFFVPQVPLTSLTVTSTWKQGFPSYQTWFATLRGKISGTVTDACGLPGDLRVQLLAENGTVLGSQPVGAGGAYSFGALARGVGYSVRIDPDTLPAGYTSPVHSVSSLGATGTADLTVHEAHTVHGTVTGDDVDGLTVSLDPAAAGATRTTSTANGAYSFAEVPAGDYTVTVEPSAGHTVEPAQRDVTVACGTVDVAAFEIAVTPPTSTPPTTPSTTPPTTPATTPPTSSSSTGASTTVTPTETTGPSSVTGSPTDTLPVTATTSGGGVAPTGASSSPGGGGLANTGTTVGSLLAVGGAAIALGAVLLVLTRRRIRPRRA